MTHDPFYGKQEINIVFLGGSITEGAHASQKENCYANRTGEWLKRTYGTGRTLHYHNKGVGGTPSQYGLLRLARDVIAKRPDMVFIEFAVNDGGADTRVYMEGIVRMLQESCDPYIVFLYTTDENYRTNTAYHAALAAHYGIPEISLKDALRQELNGENARERGYMTDAVHPSDSGHDVYYREMVRCLSDKAYYQKAQRREKMVADSRGARIRFISSAGPEVTRQGDWELNTENPDRPWARSCHIGDSLSFSFNGTVLAIEHGLHKDSTMYELWIDGKLTSTLQAVYDTIDTYQLVQGYADLHLPVGQHTVTIKTVPSTDERYTGSQALFYNFLVGELTE